jgi:hypothetical protein
VLMSVTGTTGEHPQREARVPQLVGIRGPSD